jgi:archaemetzincin
MRYLGLGVTPDLADGDLVAAVSARLTAEFRVPVRQLELPALDFAFDPGRGQYRSIAVLEMLARRVTPGALKLVALTGRDLFVPVLTFVYGHAQLGGRLAVVSVARLRQEFYGLPPNREILLERALKEALHETGHTFGLVHCGERECAMSLSTNVGQIDRKRAGFCPSCAAGVRTPGLPRQALQSL